MANVTIPSDVVGRFQKFSDSVKVAFGSFELLQKHIGEYVAVGEGKILGFSDNKEELMKRYASIEGLFVDLITPHNILWIL